MHPNATDPVEDREWPDIRAYDPDRDDARFPEGWGAELTERDQAAIDAGNAQQ